MEKSKTPPRMSLSILEEIRRRDRARAEVASEVANLENLIRQRRHATHMGFVERVAAKAGVDPREIVEEGRRRNKVERRLLDQGYERIRARAKAIVREESARLRDIRARYLERCAKPAREIPNDPELKFMTPVEGGHWTGVEMDPPGGMVGGGCHDPILAERSYGDAMSVGGLPPRYDLHRFFPRAYAATGEDDSNVFIRLSQTVTLRRDPLTPGLGDFRVSRLSVNLSGVGYSERREGEGCPMLLDSCGLLDAHYLRLRIRILQALSAPAESGGFLDATVLTTDPYYLRTASCSEPVVVELGTATFPCDFRIFNPDSGGSEPWLLVTLETQVSGCNEGAWAQIDFSQPDHDGLALGCVSLFGDYV